MNDGMRPGHSVLRRRLAVGFSGSKGSEEGFSEGVLSRGSREGTQKAETRLFESTTRLGVRPLKTSIKWRNFKVILIFECSCPSVIPLACTYHWGQNDYIT